MDAELIVVRTKNSAERCTPENLRKGRLRDEQGKMKPTNGLHRYLRHSQATAAAVAPSFMNNRGDKTCVLAGRSAVAYCPNSALDAPPTSRIQTEPPLGDTGMNSVSTLPGGNGEGRPPCLSASAPVLGADLWR